MSYYYFAATLPWLTLDGDLPMSVAEFRARAAAFLSRRDAAALAALEDSAQPAAHPFVRAWRAVDTHIRNAVARARAARARRDATPYLREAGEPFDGTLDHRIGEAFALPDPLQREQALDRIRWDKLDALAGTDPFAPRAVLAYGLKLRLVARWAALREEVAAKHLDALITRQPKLQDADKEQ
jgi:hypothetical protein